MAKPASTDGKEWSHSNHARYDTTERARIHTQCNHVESITDDIFSPLAAAAGRTAHDGRSG